MARIQHKALLCFALACFNAKASTALAEGAPTPDEESREDKPDPQAPDFGDSILDIDPDDDDAFLDPALSSENVILVWGNRLDKPYERDTILRISGQELRKRGINNLGEALDQLPELYLRAAGRGGTQIDIRGARKGSVKILLDGIAVSDPYYGNIDLSAIPVTDIEQIRVSSNPASPIDGAGGPGGVIEILTTDAYGKDSVRARISANSLPAADVSATGRMMLTQNAALRLSVSVTRGANEFELRPASSDESHFLGEDRLQSVGAVRFEYRKRARRIVADLWTQQGTFVEAPTEDLSMNILSIDGEGQGRLGIAFDDKIRGFLVQSHAYYHLLSRQSTYYKDAELSEMGPSENLQAARAGLSLLANRPYGNAWHFIASSNLESDHADVEGFDNQRTEGRVTLVQGAVAAQFDKGPLDLQASLGVALPLGLVADAWLEYKVVSAYTPSKGVTLTLTSGFKGRTPTLRERFRLDIGNESLGPEKVLFGEARVEVAPTRRIKLSLASYLRRTNGLIRFNPERLALINSEELLVRGFDSSLTVTPRNWLNSGVSWSFGDAESKVLGTDPLDFFPAHRLSSWLRLGRGNAGATARVQYISPQIDKNTELDSRLLVQLSGYARLGEHLLFSLRAENLSGKHYEQRLGIRAPGRVVYASIQSEWP